MWARTMEPEISEPTSCSSVWHSALLFRDGLAIALLAQRPLRRANFAALTLDRHLVRRGADWWLQIPGNETKNGDPIDDPWPASLTAGLENYL